MATEQIILDIRAQVSDAQKRIKNLEKSTKQAAASTTKLNKNFEQVGATAKKLAGVFISLYAIKRVASFAKEVAKLADIQEKAEAKLLTALKGREGVQQRLIRQAQQLQKITLFGDEQTIEAQAFLAAMGLTEKAIRRLTPLVQDLATKMGGDLRSAADLIAKSVGSSTNALSRYGITIEGAVGSSERLESAIEGLNKQVGGQSEAAAKVGIGAIQQFDNVMGDFKEKIAQEYLPFISAIFKALTGKLADEAETDFEIFIKTLENSTDDGLEEIRLSWQNHWDIQNTRFQQAYADGNKEAEDYYSDQLNIVESYQRAIDDEIKAREEKGGIVTTKELDKRQKALLEKQEKEYLEAISEFRKMDEGYLESKQEINTELRKSDKDVTDAQKKEAVAFNEFVDNDNNERTQAEIDDAKRLARIKMDLAAQVFRTGSNLAEEGTVLQKTLKLAETTISAITATQKAYEWGVETGGPIVGAASAAAAAVVGALNIALVAGVTFGEGGFTGKSKLPQQARDRHGRIAGLVHEDEFVFTKEKTAALRPLFEDIHSGRIDARGLAALTKRGVIMPLIKNEFNSAILEREVGRIYQRMREEKPVRMTIETPTGYKKIVGNTTINIRK